jgi:hypothetical protein
LQLRSRAGRGVDIGDYDHCAFFSVEFGNSSADAVSRSCDNGNLVSESHVSVHTGAGDHPRLRGISKAAFHTQTPMRAKSSGRIAEAGLPPRKPLKAIALLIQLRISG